MIGWFGCSCASSSLQHQVPCMGNYLVKLNCRHGEPTSVFVQLEFHIEKMNKRTDCQLLTICHHWQPLRQTCCLPFSLYLLCFQPVIIPHGNIMYKYNCNRSCFVRVSIWHRTKRNHNLSTRAALWAKSQLIDSKCVFPVLSPCGTCEGYYFVTNT